MTGLRIDRSRQPYRIDFPDRFNVASHFIDCHRGHENEGRIAIYYGNECITYGELGDNVNRCGNVLAALGLNPGDRLFLVLRDAPAFIYAFWGAIKAGIVPVPLNTLLRRQDYRRMIEAGAPAALIYSEPFAEEVLPAGDGLTVLSETALIAAMGDAGRSLLPVLATPMADCFWLFSSGSTGRPKAAVHRHRDMVVTSAFYGQGCLGLTRDDICYSAAKLFFAYGLGNAMTFPFWVGGAAVLDPARPTPDSTFTNIERYRPTAYFGVPTLYAAQLQALESAAPDLASLRLCVSAGEALPADILERWRARTGRDILDGIGSTEALHIFISNRPGDVVPGSSGRPVPGYQARIVDESGQPAAPDTPGRLLIKGPSTAGYYWCEPEKTARTMQGDWLDTGDTYTCSAPGSAPGSAPDSAPGATPSATESIYTYCGRSDDMLKVGGIWCSPFEIEACLIAHPDVLEAAVIGRADRDGLVKPAAFVVPSGEDAADGLSDQLKAFVKSRLAPYKYPRWVTIVDSLPKTATGKIQRYRLRAESRPVSGASAK